MMSSTKKNPGLGWKKGAMAIGLISLSIVSSGGKVTAQVQEFDRFADWCENLETLTPAARRTVEVLLREAQREAQIQDCQSAEERLTNLTEFSPWVNRLWNNEIEDVSPLSSLTNLTWLSLGENQIEDVTPLSSLTNLWWLILGENQIEDVTPLSSLTKLLWLMLDKNQIEDVTPLSFLTNLELLDLGKNQIEDVTPLSFLTNLELLDLGKNQIGDVSPLSSLSKLERLLLWENKIIDRTCPVEPQSVCQF